MMQRLGIISPPGRGHLYPATALGRRLKSCGFSVTVFDRITSSAVVNASGLELRAIDRPAQRPLRQRSVAARLAGPDSIKVLHEHALLVLESLFQALIEAEIEMLLVDQADFASGSVADRLGIPFLNLSMFPPTYLTPDSPPFVFPWAPRDDQEGRLRNTRGNAFLERLCAPILHDVNAARRTWGLTPAKGLNDLFSTRAILTQLPRIMDFPRSVDPPPIRYAAPFNDGHGRPAVNFPWSRLNGKPMVFASMGTVRCASRNIFEVIASACGHFDLQLVLTLGGMDIMPGDIGGLPDDAVVVHFAPQTELLKRASLCITHGGMNTVLDSAAWGVPMILLPVTDDQPGVAARIEWLGSGRSLPLRQLSADRLKEQIEIMLGDASYLCAARALREHLEQLDGLQMATEIVKAAAGFN
jgi:zeaxanthin glucosyltransferase